MQQTQRQSSPRARLRGALGGVALALAASPAPGAGERLPDWELDAVDGEMVHFYEHSAGVPAVLVFWASWCPYCRELMPGIEAVRREYADAGVRFYALNVWEDGDARAYFRERGYGLMLLLAADLVAEDYGVHGTPAVYVADGGQTKLYERRRGDDPADVLAALRRTLDAALAAPP
ncbi:MAG: TlpA family protein disulfide reductase [Gammaproteobacteria bacterium]